MNSALLLIPALLSTAAVAQTAFEQALATSENIQRPRAPSCPKTLPESRAIIFVFEGASGYSPRENTIIRAGLSAMESVIDPRQRSLIEKQMAKAIKQDPARPRELSKSFNVDPVALLNIGAVYLETLKTPGKESADYLYYSQRHINASVNCAQSLHAQAQQEGSPLSIRVFGFSMGGYAALQFSERLEASGIQIDRVLTVDPVSKTLGGLFRALFSSRDTRRIKKSENVERWTNYFQKIDSGSLLVGIRGSRVTEADLNTEIKKRYPKAQKRKYLSAKLKASESHMWISFNAEIKADLLELISPVSLN